MLGESVGSLAGLIGPARAGDRAAFTAICEQTLTPLFRYVSARVDTLAEAEEITQDVYLAATTSIRSLRSDDELTLLAWLFQIARHKIADHLRRRHRESLAPLEAATDVPASDPNPEDAAIAAGERADLMLALSELTPEQREVLICKYVLEFDNERTGRLLGKTTNAVNQLHHRGLASLHRLLTGGAARRRIDGR